MLERDFTHPYRLRVCYQANSDAGVTRTFSTYDFPSAGERERFVAIVRLPEGRARMLPNPSINQSVIKCPGFVGLCSTGRDCCFPCCCVPLPVSLFDWVLHV